MGFHKKDVEDEGQLQVFNFSGGYVGYILYKDYKNKYKTKKLIGQSKPSFTLTMYMTTKEANQFPQGVGKITPTKCYKILGIKFMANFTLLKVDVDKFSEPVPVEVRFTEL